jgi:two-component system CheB/CheR fusion protein
MAEFSQEENIHQPDEAEPAVVQAGRGNDVDISPPRGYSFPVAGIGGSAGALDSFTRLLQALPNDTGIAFIFVQHLDPHHASQLSEILARSTSMPVHNVEDGMSLRPNEVFVIPPNATMILENGLLRLTRRHPGLHLPVDAFFESLARAQGSRAIGVVLSGNASDGSQGVIAIKGECGLTFAQDEASAQHAGMPRNAVATGAIDYVLPPPEIARELVSLSRHPFVRTLQANWTAAEILPDGDAELKKIIHILRHRTKVDFTHYKPNTVRRRIGRRMIVKRTETLREYAQLLDQQPEETVQLYRDLLISVTSFFRDTAVFDALRLLLRDLLLAHKGQEAFRVWIPGCATGEEVYTLAICVKELTDELQLNTPVQFFGTDISELALDRARAAIYPEIIAQDVSSERLRRFFFRKDGGYLVSKAIRETCVFARQDVTTDPPFGHMDLISCRNLLIYLDSALQRNVLPLFHYGLNPAGLLLLGTAESIEAASDLFTVVDKQHHIYRRKPALLRRTLNLAPVPGPDEPAAGKVHITSNSLDLQKKADLIIQSKYAPPAVVIDSDLQILHFRGRTGSYLEPRSGEAKLDLLRMARDGLVIPLRRAIEAAIHQNISICETGVTVEYLGERRELTIEITPIAGALPGERYFVVVFQEHSPAAASSTSAFFSTPTGDPDENAASIEAQNRELLRQVAELRDHLRGANEDHEAHTEELRAANEEVRSANEELQSTNEELSTTKEELQSANEELTMLNEELQNRNNELNTVNSDLGNLVSAVDVAFVMVDKDLRLRRFSATAEKLLGICPVDIGHPLTNLQGRMDLTEFQPLMRQVVETLTSVHRDIQDRNGHWFSATIRPYRTLDDHIAGAVVMLVDIDVLKRSLRAAEEARDYAEGLIETVREPLVVLDEDLRVQRATSAFYEAFQVSRVETEGRFLYDLGSGQWNIARLRELLGNSLFRNRSFRDFEIEYDFPHIGRRTMRLNGRRISPDDGHRRSVLLAIEDITERRRDAEVRYQRLFETARDGMLIFEAETGKLTDVNPFFLELTGFTRERLIGCHLPEIEAFRLAEQMAGVVEEARLHVARHDGIQLGTSDGRIIVVDLVANRYSVGGQEVVQINIWDVTARNRAFEELRDSEERFRLFVDSVRDYGLFQTDMDGLISSWNSGAERMLGYTETEILGQPFACIFTPEDQAKNQPEQELATARSKGSSEDEHWHVRKNGDRFFASGVLTSVRDQAGHLRGFAKVMRDITERNRADELLREQAHLLELSQDLIIVRKLDGTILFSNRAAAQKYGWSKEETSGKVVHVLLRTQFPRPVEEIENELLTLGRWEGELVHMRRDNSLIIVWSRWALQLDAQGDPSSVLEINSDISERKRSEEQVLASLREKEVLLKEIHHRVKNNLQIISSLLNLQMDFLIDKQAQAILQEMNTRVRSIAAIHEMLYAATDLSRINFAQYLQTLVKDVASVYVDHAGGVRVEVDAEQVSLEIVQAVPCGLIVNELLTNALKHAFPENRHGLINIFFRNLGKECVLEVADNGIGLSAKIIPAGAKSMGYQLLDLLVQQIKGQMEIHRSSGTRFTITFRLIAAE